MFWCILSELVWRLPRYNSLQFLCVHTVTNRFYYRNCLTMYSYLKFSSQVYHNTPMPHTKFINFNITGTETSSADLHRYQEHEHLWQSGGTCPPQSTSWRLPCQCRSSVTPQYCRWLRASLELSFPRHCCRRETLTTRDRQTAGFFRGWNFSTDGRSQRQQRRLLRPTLSWRTDKQTDTRWRLIPALA